MTLVETERVSLRGLRRTRRIEVPEEIRSTESLAASDYAYACEVVIPPADLRSAEQWARDVFEGAPGGLRQFIVLAGSSP